MSSAVIVCHYPVTPGRGRSATSKAAAAILSGPVRRTRRLARRRSRPANGIPAGHFD